jgi:predicted Zn-dependent protease
VVEALVDAGLDEAEVYAKRGRSRRLEHTPHTAVIGFHHEQGWAVRAGGPRASFFACGTGEPSPEGPWPEPDGHPLRLPEAQVIPAWKEPSELDLPLIGEREGSRLLEGIARELDTELAGSRLAHALLEDGSSESEIVSQRGVRARWRSRVAILRVEAWGAARGGGPRPVATLRLAERDARRFNPKAVARRLADLLAVRGASARAERDRGELLLAPEVGRRLLAALLPLVVGPEAPERIARFLDRRGRVGGPRLTVIDHGRLPGGLLEAPVDGEGLPTREVVLIEEGSFRQPLVSWRQARAGGLRPSGCSRRPSWRDLPAPGPTHLYLRPDRSVSVASLLADIARGYYLIEAAGAVHVDFEEDRFALPVAGFAVERGRAVGPVAGVELRGAVSTLLRNLQAVGRDLSFAPLDGMIGCPTLLVTGLELVRSERADAA